jgi:hypothetical protein
MSTYRKPKVLLLGAHRWRREPVVQFARDSGLEPLILLYEEEALPAVLSQSLQPGQIIRQSSHSPLSAQQIAQKLPSSDVWFALGLDDYVCEFAAELSELATKRTLPPTAARETLHKHLLRQRWNRLCEDDSSLCPVPFRLLSYADLAFKDCITKQGDLKFDESGALIVKPDALDASIGIHKLTSYRELDGAVNRIRDELAPIAADAKPLGINISPALLVEHQIPRSQSLHPGAEYSAEFLSVKIQNDAPANHILMGITQKYINPDTFVEAAHCFPSETFPNDLHGTLYSATSALLNHLHVQFCISHWEYIVTTDQRLALVEAQLRPAGDHIMELVSRATGRNPYRALFDLLGKTKDHALPNFPADGVAAIFFPHPKQPVLGKFSVVCGDKARALWDRNIFIDPNLTNASRWSKNIEWYSRYLAVIVEGSTFEIAKQKCENILTDLRVDCALDSGEVQHVHLGLPI